MFHVFGAGRGGTSLLAGLLDAHPECEVCLEKWSLTYLVYGDDRATRVDDYVSACVAEERNSSARIWGHKSTTEQIAWLGDVSYFIARTRDIPAIFILRDGRMCIPSKVQRTRQPLDRAINSWRYSVRFWKMLGESGTPLLTIKLEELVTRPVATLNAACAFLGMAFDDVMLQGTRSDKIRPEYRRDGFDQATAALPEEEPAWVSEIAEELQIAGYAK